MFTKPTELPIDQVKAMRSRGFDNNQIVQALQRNGYTSTQIFDALNQAELMSGAPGMMDPYQQQGFPQAQPPQQQLQQAAQQPMDSPPPIGVSSQEIEEMVETIIEEKWADISKDINKIVEWKGDVESKLIKIEQRLDSMKDDFDRLQQAILGKIGEYDKNILAVGAEIKAMERVFSKVLPVFTENVNELSRVTQTLSSAASPKRKD